MNRICLIICLVLMMSYVSKSDITLDLMTSSEQTPVGDYQIYKNEMFKLRTFIRIKQPIKEVLLNLILPVTSQWVFEPQMTSYQLSNFQGLNDVIVTSDLEGGSVTFLLRYNFSPIFDDVLIYLNLLANDVTIGNSVSLKAEARISKFDNVTIQQMTSPVVDVKCIGPCVAMTSSESESEAIRGNTLLKGTEIRFESCDWATEEARGLQILVNTTRGIVYSGGFQLTSSSDILSENLNFYFNKWIGIGNLSLGHTFQIQFDCGVTCDILLNSDVSTNVFMTYKSKTGLTFEQKVAVAKPTERVELMKCEMSQDILPTGHYFDITTCLSIPPGTIELDVTINFLTNSDVTMKIISGYVTSQLPMIFSKSSSFQNQPNLLTRMRRQADKSDTWDIGKVTNENNEDSVVIITTRILPETFNNDENKEGTIIASMTSLGQILERNVIVTSNELELDKSIQVVSVSDNPDLFQISLSANSLFDNTTLYDVTITEVTAGLEIRSFSQPTDQSLLSIQPDIVVYKAGNLTGLQTVQLTYVATLRNLGSEISASHYVTTYLQYFTPLNTPRSLNTSICIAKTTNYVTTTCVWCSALVIIACLIAGFLLAFLIMLLALCLPKSFPVIEPSIQKSKSGEKYEHHRNRTYDVTNMADVIAMDNEAEMFHGVELLEFDRLRHLEQSIDDERIFLTKRLLRHSLTHVEKGDDREMTERLRHSLNILEQEPSSGRVPQRDVTQTKEDMSVEREKELSNWKNKLNEFSAKFQKEMTSLIAQRHSNDAIEERVIKNLQDKVSSDIPHDDDVFDECITSLRGFIKETDDVIRNIASNEYLLLTELYKLYGETLTRIQRATKFRDEIISKKVDKIAKEKKIWNKMATQQLEIVKLAKRQEHISYEDGQEIIEMILSEMTNSKTKFEDELSKVIQETLKHYDVTESQLRSKRFIDDDESEIDDVIAWMESKLQLFRKFVEMENDIEDKLDEVASQMNKSISSVTSQTKTYIKATGDKLKSSLMNLGVNERWIDDVVKKQGVELKVFRDDVNKTTVQSALPPSREIVSVDDVNILLLHNVNSSQPSTPEANNYDVIKGKNWLLKDALKGTTMVRMEQRLRKFQRLVEKKKSAVNDVTIGDDEDTMRRELQEKLTISSKGLRTKNKKSHLLSKRHQSITSYRVVQMALTKQLRQHMSNTCNAADLMRIRSSIEYVTMTLLEMMTSSGKLTSPQCRLVLQEFRSQNEETKGTFHLERKRREENLKRKTERNLIKNKGIFSTNHTSLDDARGLLNILRISDDVIDTSSRRIDDERSTMQNFLETRSEVYNNQERALLEQELDLIRKLAGAIGVSSAGMKESLELILPEKSREYISTLSRYVCNDDATHSSSEADQSNSLIVTKIKEIVMKQTQKPKSPHQESRRRHQVTSSSANQSRKLSPLPGALGYPGVRPEPVGRTSTPEQEERYSVYD